MRVSKKLKALVTVFIVSYLLAGLGCTIATFLDWRKTGNFVLSGPEAPSFRIAYVATLFYFLPLSIQIKHVAKQSSQKVMVKIAMCVVVILIVWLLIATAALLSFYVAA